MIYMIMVGKFFNMVLFYKDIRDFSLWFKMLKVEIMFEMMDQFRGWDFR